jgi:hypothetical protein
MFAVAATDVLRAQVACPDERWAYCRHNTFVIQRLRQAESLAFLQDEGSVTACWPDLRTGRPANRNAHVEYRQSAGSLYRPVGRLHKRGRSQILDAVGGKALGHRQNVHQKPAATAPISPAKQRCMMD